MEKYSGPNRRKFPRLDANFIVSYSPKKASADYDLSQTKNVSGGGALITTNKEFEKGTLLSVTVRFPFYPKRIGLTAEVISSKELVKNLVYETRVCFLDMDSGFIEELGDFISKRLK